MTECQICDGVGWYVGHEDQCYEKGDCYCTGVQVQCECSVGVAAVQPVTGAGSEKAES